MLGKDVAGYQVLLIWVDQFYETGPGQYFAGFAMMFLLSPGVTKLGVSLEGVIVHLANFLALSMNSIPLPFVPSHVRIINHNHLE